MSLQKISNTLNREYKLPEYKIPSWFSESIILAIVFLIPTVFLSSLMGFSGSLFYSVVVISLIIGFIMPTLHWRKKHLWSWRLILPLIIWFLAMYFVIPRIAQPIYVFWTKSLLPPYGAIELEKVYVNSGGEGLVSEPFVNYVYKTDNVITGYSKIHDFYKEYLEQRGWVVVRDDESGSNKVITFINQRPRASIGIYVEKYGSNNEIKVSIQRAF